MVTRRGHSLPELIVTLAFLAATLGAVAAGGVAATRRTDLAAGRQDAVVVAAAVLDSLLAISDPPPADDSTLAGEWRVAWRVREDGEGKIVRVGARHPAARVGAVVEGFWAVPPVPLPVAP